MLTVILCKKEHLYTISKKIVSVDLHRTTQHFILMEIKTIYNDLVETLLRYSNIETIVVYFQVGKI